MVKAIMIIEIAGRPPEHVSKALEEHVSHLDKIKVVKVINKKFHKPKEHKEQKGFYTTFAEVEFETDTLRDLFDIMFDFMPSSIEILEPNNLSLTSEEATSLVNNLTGRLHRFDDLAKIAQTKIYNLSRQLHVASKVLNDNGLIKDGKLVIKEEEKSDKKSSKAKKDSKK